MSDSKEVEKTTKNHNTVLRLPTICFHCGNELYELPETEESPYIVDDSHFVPMSEAVKQLNANYTGSLEDISNYYDFPDGKDTGIEVPITRTSDGKDITEISTDIMNKVKDINENIENAKATKARKDAFEASIAKVNNKTIKTE